MNFGTALAGYGNAQPQIQQMQQLQQKKQQEEAQAKALQQYGQQRKQSGQQGGQGLPPLDQMMDMLSKSGLPADQQFEALKSYGAFATPFDKMASQMDMASQKLTMQQQMLDERLKTMKDLQDMRDRTSSSNTDKRVGAETRGQDIRSEDANRGMGIKIIEGNENRKIKQQNADTSTDRANTAKRKELKNEDFQQQKIDLSTKALKQKNDLIIRGQDKTYQAKLASIAAKGKPEHQQEFNAAKTEFTQASANYRTAKLSPSSTPEEINDAANKAVQAQQKMESAAAKAQSGGGSTEAAAPAGLKPEDITPENLEHTAKVNNMTVEEVKQKLGVK